MNRAVMRPQAMNAAMFGMIMPLRKVPNRCTPTRAPPRVRGCDSVVMTVSFSRDLLDGGGAVLRGGARRGACCRRGWCGEGCGGERLRLCPGVPGQFGPHVGQCGRGHGERRGSEADEHDGE